MLCVSALLWQCVLSIVCVRIVSLVLSSALFQYGVQFCVCYYRVFSMFCLFCVFSFVCLVLFAQYCVLVLCFSIVFQYCVLVLCFSVLCLVLCLGVEWVVLCVQSCAFRFVFCSCVLCVFWYGVCQYCVFSHVLLCWFVIQWLSIVCLVLCLVWRFSTMCVVLCV